MIVTKELAAAIETAILEAGVYRSLVLPDAPPADAPRTVGLALWGNDAADTRFRVWCAWRALVGPQKMEATVVAKPELAAGGLAAWQALFAGLRLALLPGVDPNPLNLFAASTLADEAGGGALVIVRLESSASSASQFRLTVASPSPPLCAAVHGLVVSICTTA